MKWRRIKSRMICYNRVSDRVLKQGGLTKEVAVGTKHRHQKQAIVCESISMI
jgi:hypothetical protein